MNLFLDDSINGKLKNAFTSGKFRKISARLLAGIFVLVLVQSFASNVSVVAPSGSFASEVDCKSMNFELTKEQVIEDIGYVLKTIKENHISAVEKIPDEVTNRAKMEIENLKNNVDIIDEWRIVSRIVAKLHDAHTGIDPPAFLNHRLPFDTEYSCGKFICTSGDFKDCEIVAINNISIEELYGIFKNHFSREIDEYAEYKFFESPLNFIPEWKLAICGIDTLKPVEVSFSTDFGIQNRFFDMAKIESGNEHPQDLMLCEIDKENDIAVLTLNKCCWGEYELWERVFGPFLKDVSSEGIGNLILDLRKNDGGNALTPMVLFPFLTGVWNFKVYKMSERENDDIVYPESQIVSFDSVMDMIPVPEFTGNVFILTSHATFSAAVDTAVLFADNNKATIVGEVPGGSPTCFGFNTPDFYLPKSGMTLYMTCGRFERPDETKDGTKLIPDVQVRAEDALNKVYEIVRKRGK